LGIVLAAVLVVAFLVPDRQRPEAGEVELASDYPVPPLDLVVPDPSRPRRKAVADEPARPRGRRRAVGAGARSSRSADPAEREGE
jgi:NADH-quinone oxidoreductase subunit H